MANLRENTTIGGSIAITAKNISEYLENISGGNGGGGLELHDMYFEDYISINNITDLNQLSPLSDIGLFATKGGITTTNENIYGKLTVDQVLTQSFWKDQPFTLETNYILTKSPTMDRSIMIVLNLDPNPAIKRLALMCYHITTKVWYRMDTDTKTGQLTKNWVVDENVVREFKNFSTVASTLKTEFTKTSSDLLSLNTRMGKVETLSASNKNRLDGVDKKITDIEKDKISGGSVVQVVGASTVNVMSQKSVSDELKKKQDNLTFVGVGPDVMKTGAYGLGSNVISLGSSDSDNTGKETGFYYQPNPTSGAFFMDVRWSANGTPAFRLSNVPYTNDFFLNSATKNGALTLNDKVKIIHDGNTWTDRNGYLKNKSDNVHTLTTSNLVQVTGTATANVMSQKSVTDELNKKLTGGNVVQVTGASVVDVMSQKIVTDELNKRPLTTTMNTELGKKITGGNVVQAVGSSTVDVMSQKVTTDQLNLRPLTTYVNTELNKRITGGNVVQGVGTSLVDVLSQKAITDLLSGKFDDKGNLTSSINLDDLKTSAHAGVYANPSKAVAKKELNYPNGGGHAGALLVLASAGVTQIYITYRSNKDVIWKRGFYRNAWTEWSRVIDTDNVLSSTGNDDTNPMSQKAVTDGLNSKISGGNVVQAVGTSTVDVISQKIVTDQLNLKVAKTQIVQAVGTSTTNIISQKVVTDQLNLRPLTTVMNTELGKKRDLTDSFFTPNTGISLVYTSNGAGTLFRDMHAEDGWDPTFHHYTEDSQGGKSSWSGMHKFDRRESGTVATREWVSSQTGQGTERVVIFNGWVSANAEGSSAIRYVNNTGKVELVRIDSGGVSASTITSISAIGNFVLDTDKWLRLFPNEKLRIGYGAGSGNITIVSYR